MAYDPYYDPQIEVTYTAMNGFAWSYACGKNHNDETGTIDDGVEMITSFE